MARNFVLSTSIACVCILAATSAGAQGLVQALLDLDNDAATGCLVATADGDVAGVDGILTAPVDVAGAAVGPTTFESCEGATFGPPQVVDGGTWSVGAGLGTAGSDAIEFRFPVGLAARPGLIRIAFVSCSGGEPDACLEHTGSTDAMLTDTGLEDGAPMVVNLATGVPGIPTIGEWGLVVFALLLAIGGARSLRRRRIVGSGAVALVLAVGVTTGVVWAAVLLDGQVGDWASIPLFGTDPESDAPGMDILAAFQTVEGPELFLRVDAIICPTRPSAPGTPSPSDGADLVDPSTTTTVDWADVPTAAEYDVFVGDTCPPPAYPDSAFQTVADSQLDGLTLNENTTYCWQVVAVDGQSCPSRGPVWTFQTACMDPPVAPQLTSSTSVSFPSGTTSAVYNLTFSEYVNDVAANLTWNAIIGTGTMQSVTAIDGSRYEVAIAGVADGDEYRLTVGGGITDACGGPLPSPVVITLKVKCAAPAEVPAGDWVVDMHDSYGDGWQTTTSGGGPGITVTLNTGTVFEVGLCTPYQSNGFDCVDEDYNGSDVVTIPPGILSADWYFPGDFWGEISFEIYFPGGELAAAYGSGAGAGPIELDYCSLDR